MHLNYESIEMNEEPLGHCKAYCNTLQHAATHNNKLQLAYSRRFVRCTVCKYTATHCNTQLLVTQYCNSNPNVGSSTGITLNIDTNVSSRIHPMRTNSHTTRTYSMSTNTHMMYECYKYDCDGAHVHDAWY